MKHPPADFVPSGFFALRTPLLPLRELLALGDAAEAALRARIEADPAVREAVFVASPSLDDAIEAWLKDERDPRARGVPEILLRYFARMCARPTPFGLFSGCSVGRLDEATRLTLAPCTEYRRHTRLDMHYLDALCDALRLDPEVAAALPHRPSTGLYATPTHVRYAAAKVDPKTRARTYDLVSIERTEHLDATLRRARSGARPAELAEAIVGDDPEIAREEADAFVRELVETEVLASELLPSVTCDEPLEALVGTLKRAGAGAADTLARTGAALVALDRGGVGGAPETYRTIAAGLEALPAKPELARLFHVDLHKPAPRATLGRAVVRELTRAVELLARIGEGGEPEALRRFKQAFVERYETREVPLTEALDDEGGIGFATETTGSSEPTPLLEGLVFPEAGDAPRVAMGAREHHLLRRLMHTVATGETTWALSDDDVKALSAKTPARLPDAFAVMATIEAASAEAIDRGEFAVHVDGISGPSGAPLLGRFCLGDPELRAHVEAHLRAEEALRPDALFAEIVHLPEGRLGNILCRPLLRPWEIAYLGRGTADTEHTIAIEDLFVSVRGGRVVLRSARLDREVVPRMTTAHNHPHAALGIYRFLCALQADGGRPPGFSWGPLASAPFLPRVTHGRVVLSPARWLLDKEALAPLAKATPQAALEHLRAVREARRIPRWVALADGDNVLPVDLDHTLHVRSFVQLVKGRTSAMLFELPGEDALVAEGPEGRFSHEIVVPFVRRAAEAPRLAERRPREVVRSFPPGSEWLYAKIYCGTAVADAVLRDAVAPAVDAALRSGAARSWFFIRYSDPHFHLRIRFRGDPARLTGEILPALHDRVASRVASGQVWRVQLDTYEREVERYGGAAGVELAEQLFEADSEAAIDVVEATAGDDGGRARGLLALRGAHLLLVDLGLDLETRLRVARAMRASFFAEHHADAALERQVGAKFRESRPDLEAAIAPGGPPLESWAAAYAALDRRSTRLAPIVASLRTETALAGTVEDLASSFVHMHLNRVLRAEHRAQELVLYDFLARLYDAERARSRAARG